VLLEKTGHLRKVVFEPIYNISKRGEYLIYLLKKMSMKRGLRFMV
jgi:hypothetical protein